MKGSGILLIAISLVDNTIPDVTLNSIPSHDKRTCKSPLPPWLLPLTCKNEIRAYTSLNRPRVFSGRTGKTLLLFLKNILCKGTEFCIFNKFLSNELSLYVGILPFVTVSGIHLTELLYLYYRYLYTELVL